MLEDIIDETTREDDEMQVLNLLTGIANLYPSLDKVKPEHRLVQTLLVIAGSNSWEEFCTAHAEHLAGIFTDEPEPKIEAPKTNSKESIRARVAQRMFESAQTKFNEASKGYDAAVLTLDAIQKQVAQVNEVITQNEFLSWDPEAVKRTEALKKQREMLEAKYLQTKAASRETIQARSRALTNLKVATAELNKANNPIEFNIFTTGNPVVDARIMTTIGKDCGFQLGSLERKITRLRSKLQQGGDGRLDIRALYSMEDETGSPYESQTSELTNLESEADTWFEVYSSCQYEYHMICQQRGVPIDRMPEFPDLWQEIRKSVTNLNQYAAKQAAIQNKGTNLSTSLGYIL